MQHHLDWFAAIPLAFVTSLWHRFATPYTEVPNVAWTEASIPAFKSRIMSLEGTLGEIANSAYLPMLDDPELRCVIRDADHDPNDLPPPGYGAYLINEDLTLDQVISLSHLNDPGADGNMIFIVTGNLTCPRFISEWGSFVVIGGDLTVSELMFTAREDSAHYVVGDISVQGFIGRDIWLEFETGREVALTYGIGYALRRQRPAAPVPLGKDDVIRPRYSEAESLAHFGLEENEALNDLDMQLYDDPHMRTEAVRSGD